MGMLFASGPQFLSKFNIGIGKMQYNYKLKDTGYNLARRVYIPSQNDNYAKKNYDNIAKC